MCAQAYPPPGMPFSGWQGPGLPFVTGMPPANMPPPVPVPITPDAGAQHTSYDGIQLSWFEWIFANEGQVTIHNEPEFSVRVPDNVVPCDIVASIEQIDPRSRMGNPIREKPVAILVKVYENVDFGNCYSRDMICRSNWIAVRDSMVAFTATSGAEFKILAEFPDKDVCIDRMVFRCYASRPSVMVTAATASFRHMLVEPTEPPKAKRFTFVGTGKIDPRFADRPEELEDEFDSLRKPEFDIDPGIKSLIDDAQKECIVM